MAPGRKRPGHGFDDHGQLAVDVYYDAPVGNNGQALSVYTAFVDFNFGPNYTRNNGVMNPANGNRFSNVLNGAGNAFPLVGTGNVLYAQAGYKLKNGLLGTYGTFMPYASVQHSTFGRLADPVNFYDVGINWLLAGHTSKLTMAYQSRPIYTTDAGGIAHATTRKGSAILQYQVFFN